MLRFAWKSETIPPTGVQDAQTYLQDASKRAPSDLVASNLAPTWRPRDSQKAKASGKRLKGGWEALWDKKAPKSHLEPLQTSNVHLQASILDLI